MTKYRKSSYTYIAVSIILYGRRSIVSYIGRKNRGIFKTED